MFFGKKVTGPAEWLLVCLGNYGKQYENTRHNIGFMAAERLIDKRDLRCNRLRFRALTELIEFGGARVLLMMPQTYMNLSGEAVGEAARFYKIMCSLSTTTFRCRSASCASATRAPPAGTTASRTSSPTSAPMCSRA